MSARRKISIRKVIQTLVTIILVTGCTIAMLSADRQHSRRLVKDVQLKIESPAGVGFLTEDAVRNMLFTSRHINPTSQSVLTLDERAMEAILKANPWVKDAQVYTDAERVMHIILTQRVPVVRLFEEDGNSYYLDAALQAMPLSSQYTHYTPVVTGVPHLLNDTAADIAKGKIVGLINFLNAHAFWNAQVSQVEMRADGGFELIPILGKQRIILGDTNRISQKLDNLLAFYKQIQNKIGWDKYTSIDLRYNGQIVASPALQWKRPADAAFTNMSWLKAIMDHAPASQNEPGGDAAANSDSLTSTNAPQPAAPIQAVAAVTPQPKPAAVARPKPVIVKAPVHGRIIPASPAKPKPKPAAATNRAKPADKPTKKITSHDKNNKPHAAIR